MTPAVTVEVAAGVAVLTLNRPEHLNAYTAEMGRLLSAAYSECDRDDDVRVIVLTGVGRAFCAGADFSGGASPSTPRQTRRFRRRRSTRLPSSCASPFSRR